MVESEESFIIISFYSDMKYRIVAIIFFKNHFTYSLKTFTSTPGISSNIYVSQIDVSILDNPLVLINTTHM